MLINLYEQMLAGTGPRAGLYLDQLALIAETERNQLILDSAGEGIFGLDTEGRVTFCNRAAADMLGYGADELLGQAATVRSGYSRCRIARVCHCELQDELRSTAELAGRA